jgi:acyl carrier protein
MSTGNDVLPDIRQKVTKIWTDVLTVGHGEENATFFELNGESISATRIASRIDEEFGVWIEVADIFEDDPTLEDFIKTVASRVASSTSAA